MSEYITKIPCHNGELVFTVKPFHQEISYNVPMSDGHTASAVLMVRQYNLNDISVYGDRKLTANRLLAAALYDNISLAGSEMQWEGWKVYPKQTRGRVFTNRLTSNKLLSDLELYMVQDKDAPSIFHLEITLNGQNIQEIALTAPNGQTRNAQTIAQLVVDNFLETVKNSVLLHHGILQKGE